MRITPKDGLRFRNTHQFQHAFGFRQRLLAVESLMQSNRLGNLFAHREYRVQRGHRFLEYHRHVRAAHALHLRLAEFSQIDNLLIATTQQQTVALDNPARLFQQTH
ncbi:hypothetical protein D3C71_958160 [compost metagenome]